jgi:hypothetical protein
MSQSLYTILVFVGVTGAIYALFHFLPAFWAAVILGFIYAAWLD